MALVADLDNKLGFLTPMNLLPVKRSWPTFILILLAGIGPLNAGQPSGMSEIVRLDGRSGACRNPRISVNSQQQAAVGWIVTSPDGRDSVYLSLGSPMLWEYINPVGPPDESQPRDLAISIDSIGRLQAVWTAMEDGRRVLKHAVQDVPSGFSHSRIRLDKLSFPEDSEADFPILSPDATGGIHIVWQQTGAIQSSIHAVYVDAQSNVVSLGRVSGVIPMAMSPQVLSHPTDDRLQVAWYEIEDLGHRVRVDQWNAVRQRWVPSRLERRARQFESFGQPSFHYTELGLVAGWQAEDAGGLPRIQVGLDPAAAEDTESVLPVLRTVDQPPGDHGQLGLSGRLPGRLTMAWSVLTEGRQQIQIHTLDFETDDIQPPQIVSSEDQRFASSPDHVTLDDWSAVIWVDQARDGGNGGVYYREIIWPDDMP